MPGEVAQPEVGDHEREPAPSAIGDDPVRDQEPLRAR